MIVRELVTLIGFKVDGAAEKKAQGSVDGLKKGMQILSGLFAGGVIVNGFQRIIGLGSDAAETMNVVSTSFEEQTEAVLEWASVQATELGRSEFAMRDYAATLGALLTPMTGSAKASAMMSMQLAQLTVDLGSFFNAAEPDVLLALRSGITGESEPLKRFGIIMSVAALDAFALKEGIGKTTKEMTEAEKTTLSYNFIMAATTKAQGDAARTAGGYANLTKALGGAVTDLGTEFGMMLLPAAEGVLTVLVDTVRLLKGPILAAFAAFGTAIRATVRTVDDLIESVLGVEDGLKKFAAVAVVAWAVATAPILVTIALMGLLGLAIAAIIEDLEKLSEGEGFFAGVLGEFEILKEEFGSTFEAIKTMITTAVDFWADYIFGFTVDSKQALNDLFSTASLGFSRLGDDIQNVANFTGRTATAALAPGQGIATAVTSIVNQIETTVNAPAGMDAGQLATETAAKTGAGTDRLMRRTAAQLAVGQGN